MAKKQPKKAESHRSTAKRSVGAPIPSGFSAAPGLNNANEQTKIPEARALEKTSLPLAPPHTHTAPHTYYFSRALRAFWYSGAVRSILLPSLFRKLHLSPSPTCTWDFGTRAEFSRSDDFNLSTGRRRRNSFGARVRGQFV